MSFVFRELTLFSGVFNVIVTQRLRRWAIVRTAGGESVRNEHAVTCLLSARATATRHFGLLTDKVRTEEKTLQWRQEAGSKNISQGRVSVARSTDATAGHDKQTFHVFIFTYLKLKCANTPETWRKLQKVFSPPTLKRLQYFFSARLFTKLPTLPSVSERAPLSREAELGEATPRDEKSASN